MRNKNDLLKKIIHYLQNKKKCEALSRNGFNRLWRFDYHSNLEKYISLMNS